MSAELQARLGHRFSDAALLDRALTHPSHANEHPDAGGHNQRLEFLGDAVLQLVLTEALFRLHPADREGPMTRRRAMLLSGPTLARLAREAGIDRALRLSTAEEAAGGRERASILEDALEAVVGAVHEDAGIEAARRVVLGLYGDLAGRLAALEGGANPKGRLQELVQPSDGNGALRYEVLGIGGADHARTYRVAVYLKDRLVGEGSGSSKKLAEEEAARAALAARVEP